MKPLSEFNRFDPIEQGAPTVGDICRICTLPLSVGDRPALVFKKGTEDPNIVEASIVHQDCVFDQEGNLIDE